MANEQPAPANETPFRRWADRVNCQHSDRAGTVCKWCVEQAFVDYEQRHSDMIAWWTKEYTKLEAQLGALRRLYDVTKKTSESAERHLREVEQQVHQVVWQGMLQTRLDGQRIADLEAKLAALTAEGVEAARAEAIARVAHSKQKDKQARPYIDHVTRVVALVEPSARAAAWLHDVVEDSHFDLATLRILGFEEETIAAVDVLTRRPPFDYASYIDAICASGNRVALAVKRADLIDHLSPECPESLRSRYEVALPKIEAAYQQQPPRPAPTEPS